MMLRKMEQKVEIDFDIGRSGRAGGSRVVSLGGCVIGRGGTGGSVFICVAEPGFYPEEFLPVDSYIS